MKLSSKWLVPVTLVLGVAWGNPLTCGTGTVTSYLADGACTFSPGVMQAGPGTVQLTGFSTTFNLSPDQTTISLSPNGDFTYMNIGTGNGSGPLAWTGPGTVSVQLTFDLPQLGPGLAYFVFESGIDGCCGEPGFSLINYTGGLLTTSLTTMSTLSLPPDSDGRMLTTAANWSYIIAGNTTSGQTLGFGLYYNLEAIQVILPHAQAAEIPPGSTPEPATSALVALGMAGIIAIRQARRSR